MFRRNVSKPVAPNPQVAPSPVARSPRPPAWPDFGPEGYLGQLEPSYQKDLAEQRQGLALDDCDFYHSVALPDGTEILGPWDLRSREAEYLGGIEVAGRRVLEFGPATGHLSYFMERAGAEVVSFDVGYDRSIDLLPAPGGETRALRREHAHMVSRFQNSWWYLHEAYRSQVRIVYGDIYALPGDLGTFDISTFGAILLHLRSPIAALEQAARRTTEAIVVTDSWPDGPETLHENIMRPFPNGEAGRWVIWWSLSAGAVVEMLKILGFGDTTVHVHAQRHQHGHDQHAEYTEQPMYTVVGRRS